MKPIGPISLASIEDAQARIADAAVRTPLVELRGSSDGRRIWLKLECLQPIGSFKIRGAANAMARANPEELTRGVYTGSAGNMAQGVAFNAQRLGVPCRVIVPDSAPRTKLDAVRRLGATIVSVPYDEWWSVLEDHGHPDEQGFFIHPVCHPDVIAGNGTAGLEILDDLPDVSTVVVPYGGGGLACGIASALKAHRPDVCVLAAEVDTAAPFDASLQAGRPVRVDRQPSFVDGIGGSSVLPEMWPLARAVLDGALVVSLASVRDAVRALASDAHVIAEGAGACAVAAALSLASAEGDVVAIVSGGNIDLGILLEILSVSARTPASS